ncbi:MAG TPA: hypothetical protein VLT45_20570 [Kofleriaceae bacterium]|nr:hypothetical protein [Kofleriaceae bacterium]
MNKPEHAHHHAPHDEDGCLPLPAFERVKYFYGQLLGVREFQSEQSYFFEKHRLHNRYLHGYGVVCGLEVEPCRSDDPCPPTPPSNPTGSVPVEKSLVVQVDPNRVVEWPKELCIQVECGLALDCQGNEIVVPWRTKIDVIDALGCEAKEKFLEGKVAYVTVCYVARNCDPVRPITADSCGGLLPDCVPSRIRDGFCVRVSWERPKHDDSCSACRRPCCDPCLLLAEIAWTHHEGLVIDNAVRRALAPYVTTKVAGISWVHDGTYRAGDVDDMLRHGLVIEFSDEVHTTTLRRGVVDVWVIQGGGGRRGDIYNAPVRIEPSNPGGEYSRSVRVHVGGHKSDRIDPGDRVLVQLRSAFVLDRCCRAIDGEHIGGFVPQLHEYAVHGPQPTNEAIHPPCHRPEPHPFGRWMSGNGNPGGTFESWFYVGEDDEAK